MLTPLFRPNAYNSGTRLTTLRYLAAAVMLASFTLFLVSLPARYEGLRHLVADAQPVLAAVTSLPDENLVAILAVFPIAALLFEVLVMFLYLLNALLVYRMRPDDWQALLTAAGLSAFALHITPTLLTWMLAYPHLAFIGIIMKSIGLGLAFLFLYLFPGGYYAPAWMRLFTIGWVIWSVLWLLNPDSLFSFRDPYTISVPGFVLLMLWWSIGVFTQIYRYRYVSSALERQQSKFVFLGATAVFLGYCLYVPLREAMARQPQPEAAQILFQMIAPYVFLTMVAAIPVTITLSILRFRLFDIDIIIRRTLVYAGLTAFLALVYFSSVVLLQTVFASMGGGRSQTAIVLSTLGIAALFNPLRSRLQAAIDRRFYRSKYDAEKALASFSDRVRNEVDLDRMCAHLTEVIGETLQPAEMSIWLGDGVRASQAKDTSAQSGGRGVR